MKKVFILAFMALSMTALAQQATPLNVTLTDVRLDSLRALYQAEPTMYRAALDVLSRSLAADAEEIKSAKATLKVEQQHAKEMEKSLKEAAKMAASLDKLYGQEEAQLKGMQKTVEEQQRTLGKQVDLNQESRESYIAFLDQQQKELTYALREVADRQRAIADLEAAITKNQSSRQYFVQDLNRKASELATLEAQLKERTALVKAEQKSAKSMQ